MNRVTRIAAVVLTCLLAAATAKALGTKAEERRQQLRADAEAQRQKLHLDDRVKLFASYPTPEVTFKKDPLKLTPGASGLLELSGTVSRDSTFLLSGDDLAITHATYSATGWSATIAASKSALPGNYSLSIVAPVSDAEVDLRAVEVRGKFDLEVKFPDGTTARLHAKQLDDLVELCDLEWREKGKSAVIRTGTAEIHFDAANVRVTVLASPEELSAQTERSRSAMELFADPAVQKKLNDVSQRMGNCSKLPQAQITDCVEAVSADSEKLQKELKDRTDAATAAYEQKRPHGPLTCLEWTLSGDAKSLTGEARCGEDATQNIVGAASYLSPAAK
jgi:hypothetical protein